MSCSEIDGDFSVDVCLNGVNRSDAAFLQDAGALFRRDKLFLKFEFDSPSKVL